MKVEELIKAGLVTQSAIDQYLLAKELKQIENDSIDRWAVAHGIAYIYVIDLYEQLKDPRKTLIQDFCRNHVVPEPKVHTLLDNLEKSIDYTKKAKQ